MAILTIRDLSDSARDILAERARRRRQSLNAYVVGLLEEDAASPLLDSVLDDIRSGPRLAADSTTAVELIRAERDRS